MCQHIFTCRNICKENSIQVNVDNFIPLLISHLFCRSIDTDSCIVMAEIQSAKFSYNLFNHSIYLFFVCTVCFDRDNFSSGFLCQLFSSFLCFLEIKINDCHIRSCFRKCSCCTFTNSSCSSCYKTFFAIQSHFLNNSHNDSPFLFFVSDITGVCVFILLLFLMN